MLDLTQPDLRAALALAVVALLGCAAWSDLATRRIPDRISLAVAAVGPLAAIATGINALLWSVALAALVFVALACLHARGWLGGGDVKLSTAIVLGLPPSGCYQFFIVTVLAGGMLALLHLTLRLLPIPAACPAGAAVLRRVCTAERWRICRKGPLPYGIAIACGGAWAILSGIGS